MIDPEFRIVSLCPSNTELICALGLGKYLVGVDNYSDYPAHIVRDLPRVGPDLHVDMDKVQALHPDFVLASLSVPGMEQVVHTLEKTGLRHLVISPTSLAGVFSDLARISAALSPYLPASSSTDVIVTRLQERLHRVQSFGLRQTHRPKLYWEWWPNPFFSPARDNWLTELSHLAGAENIFANEPGTQVKDDGLRISEANPDYMLAVWTGIHQDKVPRAKILSRGENWQKTSAFQSGRIFILSEGLYCRPSPRLLDGLEQLVGILHPDAVHELGLKLPKEYAPIRMAFEGKND